MAIGLPTASDWLQLVFGATALNYNADYSVGFWLRYRDGLENELVSISLSTTDLDGMYADTTRVPALESKVSNSYILDNHPGTTALVQDTWTHVTFERVGLELGFYINGVLQGGFVAANYGSRSAATLLTLGAWPTGTDRASLEIYDCKIWQAGLSAAEITAEMSSINAVRTTNLFAVYHLSTATDLSDSTGHAANLTVHGSPTTVTSPNISGTTTNITKTGSITAVGSISNKIPVKISLAGSSTAVGKTTKFDLLVDSLKGTSSPNATLAPVRTIGTISRSFSGSLTPVSSVYKRTSKKYSSSVRPIGLLSRTKLDVEAFTSSLTAAGGPKAFDITIDSVHGLIAPASTLVMARVSAPKFVSMSGSTVPTGAPIRKLISKTSLGSSIPAGSTLVNQVQTQFKILTSSIAASGTVSFKNLFPSIMEGFLTWLRHRRKRS